MEAPLDRMPIGYADDISPCGDACLGTCFAIFEHQHPLDGALHPLCGLDVDVGIRLSSRDFLSGYHKVQMLQDTYPGQRLVREASGRTRRYAPG